MLSDTTSQNETVIACDPSAVASDQMERWAAEIAPRLYKAVQEIRELPDGYAWRLPSDPEVLMLVAEDLNIERLCCPFVRYTLEIEPNRGPFWLRMTGCEDVKAFLRMTFEGFNVFDEGVAAAAGFSVSASTAMDSVETALEAVDRINERFATATGVRASSED